MFGLHARMSRAIDTSEIMQEIAARLREELDYELEARHMRLYADIFAGDAAIRVPDVVHGAVDQAAADDDRGSRASRC